MGLFDDEIVRLSGEDADRGRREAFRATYGEGYQLETEVSAACAPIVADFLPRIPLGAGRDALWTPDPDGEPFFFYPPSRTTSLPQPADTGYFEALGRERAHKREHARRRRQVLAEGRPARLLTIHFDEHFPGGADYKACIFSWRAESGWRPARGHPESIFSGFVPWRTDGLDLLRVTEVLARWLMSHRS